MEQPQAAGYATCNKRPTTGSARHTHTHNNKTTTNHIKAQFDSFFQHKKYLQQKFKTKKVTHTTPTPSTTRKNITKTQLKIATLNVKGFNEASKRQEIERWAEEAGIDILALQETKINATSQEQRGKYTAYFSTKIDQAKRDRVEQNRQAGNRPNPEQWRELAEHWGVGIMVKNALVACITDINPINGRMMKISFDTTPRLHVFSVYAPQAGRPTTEKEDF